MPGQYYHAIVPDRHKPFLAPLHIAVADVLSL
jgi:hypothetical protein